MAISEQIAASCEQRRFHNQPPPEEIFYLRLQYQCPGTKYPVGKPTERRLVGRVHSKLPARVKAAYAKGFSQFKAKTSGATSSTLGLTKHEEEEL
jgi:hypothetical protein